MIGRLSGLFVDAEGDDAVIEVGGVGYLVRCGARTLSRLPPLGEPRVVHVVAIGGSGMSPIAAVLATMGHRVSGSDMRDSVVLDRLRALDEVAYLRFASVYKGFDAAADFQRELVLLKKLQQS